MTQQEREIKLREMGFSMINDLNEPGTGECRYLLGHRSEDVTPHSIGPKPDEVFTESVKLKKLLPFLTVDLWYINPAWSGKAHFLAWDYSVTYISFFLKDNTYTFHKAGYGDIRSLSGLFRNLENLEDLNPRKIDWDSESGRFFALEPFNLPDQKLFTNMWEWIEAAGVSMKQNPRRYLMHDRMPYTSRGELFESFLNIKDAMFGGSPFWLQGADTPVDPDGNTMSFVGQVNPGTISGKLWGDGIVYMFYSLKHQLITLVGQCT